jgi:hypothetical protein
MTTRDICFGEFCEPEDNSNIRTWIMIGIAVAVIAFLVVAAMNSVPFTGVEDPSYLGY